MSGHDHDRIDRPWQQPSGGPVPSRSGGAADTHHPHRTYYTSAELDADARLEWLDDLMFAAIEGDPVALDRAADAWHKTRDELGDVTLEESRLQYMRRAKTVWDTLRNQPNHPPHKVFAAIEIISLLAKKDQ